MDKAEQCGTFLRGATMRLYQRVLLVAGLTVGMIAAGVAWERFYVSPLVEQAQSKPDPSDSATDSLPAECVEELSTMGLPSTTTDPRKTAVERIIVDYRRKRRASG